MPASNATAAVFLSYAREDSDAARRVADALRAAGIEVWFDQSELVGGDAWDQKIRQQVKECALFVPVISAHTQARREGYFRLEWHLAEDRTRLIAKGTPFLVPVVIDATAERDAIAPEAFLAVQWTRLPGGETSEKFCERVKRLLGGENIAAGSTVGAPLDGARGRGPATPLRQPSWTWPVVAVLAIGVAVFFLARKSEPRAPKPVVETKPAAETKAAPTPRPISPAPALPLALDKSIAVLPFANMSPDKDNEFFADGVHEDVITNLAKIRDLKVISRTSVLAYRDPASRNLKKIAAELGVATVLEGSVRRVGTKVRVTAQLIDARTDEHLWAETYDKDLTDVFAIQSTLAQEIASALKASLTVGERALIAERPTQNLEAYDLYVRARAMTAAGGLSGATTLANTQRIIALLEQALAKDPTFALAYVHLTQLHGRMYWFASLDPTPERRERARAALDAAVRLAPTRPETRLARGIYSYYCENDWAAALAEYRAAEAGMPNDAFLTYSIGLTHRRLGRLTEALAYFTRTLALSPHDLTCIEQQMQTLIYLRRFESVRDLGNRALAEFPTNPNLLRFLAYARLELEHDAAAFLRNYAEFGATTTDTQGLVRPYQVALLRGDFAAADQALADPKLSVVASMSNIVDDPVSRHRALVAWLRGQRDIATVQADATVAYYTARTWTPRQEPMVKMGIALAHAFAGRADVAVKLARESDALQHARDAFVVPDVQLVIGYIYLVLDRRDDALKTLRDLMTGPCLLGPESIRLDPVWARLKDDPRFEDTLKLAKPL